MRWCNTDASSSNVDLLVICARFVWGGGGVCRWKLSRQSESLAAESELHDTSLLASYDDRRNGRHADHAEGSYSYTHGTESDASAFFCSSSFLSSQVEHISFQLNLFCTTPFRSWLFTRYSVEVRHNRYCIIRCTALMQGSHKPGKPAIL